MNRTLALRTLLAFVLLLAAAKTEAQSAQSGDRLEVDTAFADTACNSRGDLTPAELARLLARYDREPSATQVVDAALRASQRDPERFEAMASRARLRGLLPRLDLGARRGQGVDLRSTTTDELGVHLTTADDLMLVATLHFDLGRLVFAAEEVAIAREQRYAHAAQTKLVRQVIHLYFLRRRLLLERDTRADADLGHAVRIAEIEALLDVFTDGAWGRMLRTARSVWTKTGANTNASGQP